MRAFIFLYKFFLYFFLSGAVGLWWLPGMPQEKLGNQLFFATLCLMFFSAKFVRYLGQLIAEARLKLFYFYIFLGGTAICGYLYGIFFVEWW